MAEDQSGRDRPWIPGPSNPVDPKSDPPSNWIRSTLRINDDLMKCQKRPRLSFRDETGRF